MHGLGSGLASGTYPRGLSGKNAMGSILACLSLALAVCMRRRAAEALMHVFESPLGWSAM